MMKQEEFSRLVTRLEQVAAASPQRYTLAVLGVAALGFCILAVAMGFAVTTALALGALVVLLLSKGGLAVLLVAKLGKLILLLAIPAWTMVKSSLTLLFARLPAPQGRELTRREAPQLFARIDELQARMKGPRVHKVLLTDEINAAIVQHPRFGLLGWERNYLILGVPLLQALGEQEALAVVAHEYGHLSGHHSRLGGFIYRFRAAWGRIQALSEQWTDWGSRLVARLFGWYAPYFNAYTFVLARQNEYLADRASAELVGPQHAANALMRADIAAQFAEARFWPAIHKRVVAEAEPLGNRSAFWQASLAADLDEARRVEYLEIARKRETDHLNTHPALKDRLAAIGVTADEAAARSLMPPQTSAAAAWFGASLPDVTADLDRAWRERVAEQWRERHGYLAEKAARLAELEARVAGAPEAADPAPATGAGLDAAEQWERIVAIGELRPDEDLLPALNALLASEPGHVSARFRRGVLLLERGDAAGIDDLEVAMAADKEAIQPGCEAAWRYYVERDADKAREYGRRWEQRSAVLAAIRAESSALGAKARLAPAELDAARLSAIMARLRPHAGKLRSVYLLRRIFEADPDVHDYVLAFETPRFSFSFGDQGNAMVKRLAKLEYPVGLFIVHLGKRPFSAFRKQIRQLGVQPLDFGARV